ncbi:MAG: hypothetical protein GF417_00965 [Candidatus Latescibacteria bacterium]|nr:hypothetical protein [Candidatus Latescibacterota bacterium]
MKIVDSEKVKEEIEAAQDKPVMAIRPFVNNHILDKGPISFRVSPTCVFLNTYFENCHICDFYPKGKKLTNNRRVKNLIKRKKLVDKGLGAGVSAGASIGGSINYKLIEGHNKEIESDDITCHYNPINKNKGSWIIESREEIVELSGYDEFYVALEKPDLIPDEVRSKSSESADKFSEKIDVHQERAGRLLFGEDDYCGKVALTVKPAFVKVSAILNGKEIEMSIIKRWIIGIILNLDFHVENAYCRFKISRAKEK